MKKLLLFTMCAMMAVTANAQWNNLNVNMTYDGFMNDIEVTDANTAWGHLWDASSGTNTATKDFARTIDGGATWTIGSVVGSPAGHAIANIWPIDGNTCYVSMYNPTGAGGRVYKTTDGGTTWNQSSSALMFAQPTSFCNVVYFWDAANGMTMGDPAGPGTNEYEIWLTADSGATWTRVPVANIPSLTNAAEYGITNLFSNADGRVWFGTTYGDVYRSIDGGNNWTKSATGLPANVTANGRFDITDVAFSDSLNGIVTQVGAAVTTVISTSDGGLTWTTVSPTGPYYSGEVEGVPGTNVFVSAGSNAAGFGSSFSTDNGATWNAIDTNSSHTAVDFINTSTGYSGEFVLAGPVGGAWNFAGMLATIACGSPLVNVGTYTASSDTLCGGDTLFIAISGTVAPSTVYGGLSWVITIADISGSTDPLAAATLVTSYQIQSPPPSSSNFYYIINDGTIFGGPVPYGTYYWTPVVFGNATAPGGAPQFLQDLVLDPNCTTTGTSIQVAVLDPTDPLCAVGINEVNNTLGISNLYPVPVQDVLNFNIQSKEATSVEVVITNVVGKTVYTEMKKVSFGENKVSLSMEQQTAGVYFITVKSGSTMSVKKFVKE